jgi:hypothetical protein
VRQAGPRGGRGSPPTCKPCALRSAHVMSPGTAAWSCATVGDSKPMANGAKSEQKPRSQAEIRRERLAAELRSNLQKRKQQARGRVAAARQVDKQNSSD